MDILILIHWPRSWFTKPFNERRSVKQGTLQYFDRDVIHCLGLTAMRSWHVFWHMDMEFAAVGSLEWNTKGRIILQYKILKILCPSLVNFVLLPLSVPFYPFIFANFTLLPFWVKYGVLFKIRITQRKGIEVKSRDFKWQGEKSDSLNLSKNIYSFLIGTENYI